MSTFAELFAAALLLYMFAILVNEYKKCNRSTQSEDHKNQNTRHAAEDDPQRTDT